MSELERALSTIGGELDYPPTPALAPAVRARVAAAPSPRRALRPREAIALAFAVLLIGAGSAFAASPGLRHSVLDWLGLRSVKIERATTLPATPPGDRSVAWPAAPRWPAHGPAPPSACWCRRCPRTRCSSRTTRRAARWRLSTAPRAGLPAAVPGVGMLITEFRGQQAFTFLQKTLGPRNHRGAACS